MKDNRFNHLIAFCCIIISLCSKAQCTDKAVEDITNSLAKLTHSDESVTPSDSATSSSEEEYNSEEEFKTHLSVQDSFFKRKSRNNKVKEKINNFKLEYNSNIEINTIILDDLSSRSRIILFQNISEITRKKIGNLEYFSPTKDGYTSKKSIPYKFGNIKFFVYCNPTNAQPGNINIIGIPTYNIVFNHINNEQIAAGRQSMANRLFITRTNKEPST